MNLNDMINGTQSRFKSKGVWGVVAVMVILLVSRYVFGVEPSAVQDVVITAVSILAALNNPINKEGF